MTVQVMWVVPARGLTLQLPQQTVIIRIASQVVFTKCSSFKSSNLFVTIEFTPFFVFSLIILLHVKTSNVIHIFKYLLESKL